MSYDNSKRAVRELLVANVPAAVPAITASQIQIGWPRASVTYPRVSINQIAAVERRVGIGELKDGVTKALWYMTVFQIDVWSKNAVQRDLILDAVRDTFWKNRGYTYSGGGQWINSWATNFRDMGFDEELQLFRSSFDFKIQWEETRPA